MRNSSAAFAAATFLAAAAFGQANLDVGDNLKKGDTVQLRDISTGKLLSWYRGSWVVMAADSSPAPQTTWRVIALDKPEDSLKQHRVLPDDFWELKLENLHSGTPLDGNNDNSVVLDSTRHSTWLIRCDKHPVKVYSDKAAAASGGLCYEIYNKDFDTAYYLSVQSDNDVVLRKSGGRAAGGHGKKIYFQFIRGR